MFSFVLLLLTSSATYVDFEREPGMLIISAESWTMTDKWTMSDFNSQGIEGATTNINTNGQHISYQFTGSKFQVIGNVDPTHGKVSIFLNIDTIKKSYNLYDVKSAARNQVICSREFEFAEDKIQIDLKQYGTGKKTVEIAFICIRPYPVNIGKFVEASGMTYDESSWELTGYGNTILKSKSENDESTIKIDFVGNQFIYYGTRNENFGSVTLLLDNEEIQKVSHDGKLSYNCQLFKSEEFKYAHHTLTIKKNGDGPVEIGTFYYLRPDSDETPEPLIKQTDAFSQSNNFEPSNEFSESSKFSQSNPFDPSSKFSQSNPFDPSSKFSQSNPFDPSSKFSQSNKFEPSNEFSESSKFSKSNPFEPSNEFTRSRSFTSSEEFTMTKKLSPKVTNTEDQTQTVSETTTATETQSLSDSVSNSQIQTVSETTTATETQSLSDSVSNSQIQTVSETTTAIETQSLSDSVSNSQIQTVSETTETQSLSDSVSNSQTQTVSETATETQSLSDSVSNSQTQTVSETATESSTQTQIPDNDDPNIGNIESSSSSIDENADIRKTPVDRDLPQVISKSEMKTLQPKFNETSSSNVKSSKSSTTLIIGVVVGLVALIAIIVLIIIFIIRKKKQNENVLAKDETQFEMEFEGDVVENHSNSVPNPLYDPGINNLNDPFDQVFDEDID